MPEQFSELARSDRTPVSTDSRRAPHRQPASGGPDPFLLTISGLLLFVVLVLVAVVHALYPGGT